MTIVVILVEDCIFLQIIALQVLISVCYNLPLVYCTHFYLIILNFFFQMPGQILLANYNLTIFHHCSEFTLHTYIILCCIYLASVLISIEFEYKIRK